jgi:hypothetical protein
LRVAFSFCVRRHSMFPMIEPFDRFANPSSRQGIHENMSSAAFRSAAPRSTVRQQTTNAFSRTGSAQKAQDIEIEGFWNGQASPFSALDMAIICR